MATITAKGHCSTDRLFNYRIGAFLSATLLMLLFGLVLSPVQAAEAGGEGQSQAQSAPMADGNPIANYWRSVRSGEEGITTASGPYTTNTLIQNGGQNWRQIRNGIIANYGGWLLGIVLAVIAVFFAVRGRVHIEQGPSDKRLMRFTLWQRIVHWFTALIFVLLALTGLTMLFGRALLIPLFGKEGFAVLAELSITLHNYLGPLFLVALLMLFVTFVAGNAFRKGDGEWFKAGGGMRKGKHASAGRYNAGEKAWFWIATVGGVVAVTTGLILDFPGFGQTREVMQLSQIIHATSAMILIAVSLGHIYIGTLGTEGAMDAMVKGHVDANWAKQHHDRWYEEMEQGGMVKPAAELESEKKASSGQPHTAPE